MILDWGGIIRIVKLSFTRVESSRDICSCWTGVQDNALVEDPDM